MSYLNQTHDPRRRATAIVTVGAVHAVLAVGLLTGLTVQFTDEIDPPFEATTITSDPPKPEPTPEPQPTPVVQYVPPPPVPPLTPPQQPEITYDDVKPVESPLDVSLYPTDRGPTVQPDPPRPAPSFTPKRPSPRNGDWITNNDYPRRPLIDGIEGSASYRLVIGTGGRVSSCELTRSTGNRALDDATCRLISDRARFEPATDEAGAKVMGTYTGSVRWEIPE